MEFRIGIEPKEGFPPEKWYPVVHAIAENNKHVIVSVPFELFEKMAKFVKEGNSITVRFYADAGDLFHIFLGFAMDQINENFILNISQDTTMIQTLLKTRTIIFISDYKFKLGKDYHEEFITTDLSGAIQDLEKFNSLKQARDSIRPDSRVKDRKIIFCTNCHAGFLFSALKRSCAFCKKENLNYDEEGNFILQS